MTLLNSFGQYELTAICSHAKIKTVETYTQDTFFDSPNIVFKGGGGTSSTPIFQYVNKHLMETQILIYFTDGHGDIPDAPDFPVLWVITPGGKSCVPWGNEVQLPSGR